MYRFNNSPEKPPLFLHNSPEVIRAEYYSAEITSGIKIIGFPLPETETVTSADNICLSAQ